MKEAAQHLVGTHDFSSLTNSNSDSEGVDCTRCVSAVELQLTHHPGSQQAPPSSRESSLIVGAGSQKSTKLDIVVRGRSFTYHMVRNIVGLLVEVGRGQIPAGDVPSIVEAKDRARAGAGAPAHGLCLCWIKYGEHRG